MSFYDYEKSKDLKDVPFSVLIMAALRNADESDRSRLQLIFAKEWAELQNRYNAPGGLLYGERTDEE